MLGFGPISIAPISARLAVALGGITPAMPAVVSAFFVAELTLHRGFVDAVGPADQGWLTQPNLALCQIEAGASSTTVLYVSDAGYRTRATDPQGVVAYRPSMTQAFSLDVGGNLDPTQSVIAAAWGSLTLANTDNFYDATMRTWSSDGQAIRILRGEKVLDAGRGIFIDPAYASLVPVFAGVMGPWTADVTTATVPLRDASYYLERQVTRTQYGGTGGLDGPAAMAGVLKPIVFGGTAANPVQNVTPTQVDAANLVYQFSDGAGTVTAVYDGGAALTSDGLVASLYSGSVAAGHFRFDGKGSFQVGSTPVFGLTADIYNIVATGATNMVRNSSMTGAAAGTPGTLPTNWSNFATSGLVCNVAGVGTDPVTGLPYVDLRYLGTTTNTFIVLALDGFASAAGLKWTFSAYFAIVGGSTAGVTRFNAEIRQTGTTDTACVLTSALQRFSVTLPLSVAGNVFPALAVNMTNSAAVDFTIRIAAPQMELGDIASPWIPTTTAVATATASLRDMVYYALTSPALAATPSVLVNAIAGASAMNMLTADPIAGAYSNALKVGLSLSADDDIDSLTLLGRLLAASGATLVPNRAGLLSLMVLAPIPAGTVSVLTLNDANIISIVPQALPSTINPPPTRLRLAYNRNWTTQTTNLAGSTTAARLAFIGTGSRVVTAIGVPDLQTIFARPTDPSVIGTDNASLETTSVNIQKVAARMIAMFGAIRKLYEITVPQSIGLTLDWASVVTVSSTFDGLTSGGKQGQVVGWRYSNEDATSVFRVLI